MGAAMTMQTRRTRPRGFAPWTPRPDSLALVAKLGGGDD